MNMYVELVSQEHELFTFISKYNGDTVPAWTKSCDVLVAKQMATEVVIQDIEFDSVFGKDYITLEY